MTLQQGDDIWKSLADGIELMGWVPEWLTPTFCDLSLALVEIDGVPLTRGAQR